MEGHPRQAEHHCWLYYNLYDHSGLSWEDLLRIGHIGVDLKVTYQHACDVTDSSSGSRDTSGHLFPLSTRGSAESGEGQWSSWRQVSVFLVESLWQRTAKHIPANHAAPLTARCPCSQEFS